MSRHDLRVVIRCEAPLSGLMSWLGSSRVYSLAQFLAECTALNLTIWDCPLLRFFISLKLWLSLGYCHLASMISLLAFVLSGTGDKEFCNDCDDPSMHTNHRVY